MTINQYRRQWLRWHRIYERRAYFIFRNAFLKSLKELPTSNLTPTNYASLIDLVYDTSFINKAYQDVYTTIGLEHGKRIVKDIEKQTKDVFTDTFQSTVLQFLFNYGAERITEVSQTFKNYLIGQISLGIENGEGISQIVNRLLKSNRFYRFQLIRIARTETTAAAGYAADVASSASGIVMEKVWVAAQDSRTRVIPEDQFDHYHMDRVRVDDGQPFDVRTKNGGVEKMRFPGDPSASPGNVINCRCSVVKVVKRDENGNIIRRR